MRADVVHLALEMQRTLSELLSIKGSEIDIKFVSMKDNKPERITFTLLNIDEQMDVDNLCIHECGEPKGSIQVLCNGLTRRDFCGVDELYKGIGDCMKALAKHHNNRYLRYKFMHDTAENWDEIVKRKKEK